MKKLILAAAMAFFASTASAAITGSSHDFSIGTYAATIGGGSACAYCHMPHNSPYTSATAPGAPLWARNITYSATYTPYNSSVTGHQTPATTPNAGSRVCLSCHDGTQAMAVVFQPSGVGTQSIATSGNTTQTMNAGGTMVGTDLSNDHPVSVTYSTTTATFGLTATPLAVFNVAVGGTVECTSCHNAHNARNASNNYPNRQFMAATGANDFCGGCHAAK